MIRLGSMMLALILAMTFSVGSAIAETAPTRLAGLTLGENISRFTDKLKMDTAMPVRFQEYQWEVEMKDIPGIRAGIVTYAKCNDPGRIMRIRLKYENDSKKFYELLLKDLKQRFGEPESWKGDSFGMLYQWKWGFTDEEGNRITLILKHNLVDPDESFGNSLKLTMPELFEKEEACFNKQHQPSQRGAGKREPPDLSLLLPK